MLSRGDDEFDRPLTLRDRAVLAIALAVIGLALAGFSMMLE